MSHSHLDEGFKVFSVIMSEEWWKDRFKMCMYNQGNQSENGIFPIFVKIFDFI